MRASIISSSGLQSDDVREHIPSSHHPAIVSSENTSDVLTPYLPARGGLPEEPGGETLAMVTIEDSKDCGEPLGDTEVTMTTQIVPESGGHEHFEEGGEHVGEGQFLALREDVRLEDEGKKLVGPSADDGFFSGFYQAGRLGVDEKIVVTATRDVEVPGGTVQSEELEVPVRTQVPGLVDLSDGMWEGSGRSFGPHPEHGYIFGFGGGCPHNPPGVYVTPAMKASVIAWNAGYRGAFEDSNPSLSFNDASLQFGGWFDNGGSQGRDSRCHVSHRRGVDIDLNSTDTSGSPLRYEIINEEGEEEWVETSRLDEAVEQARLDDLIRVNSDGIHFRLSVTAGE